MPQLMTRLVILRRAFLHSRAANNSIATPYVYSMLLCHMHMLGFTFTLLKICTFWTSVRHTWQASTGSHGISDFNSPEFTSFRPAAPWHWQAVGPGPGRAADHPPRPYRYVPQCGKGAVYWAHWAAGRSYTPPSSLSPTQRQACAGAEGGL
jgi:hypothetical protein